MWFFLFLWMSWPSPFSFNVLIQHQVTAELAPDSQKKWEVAWKDSSFGCVLPTRTQNGLLSLSCKAFAKWRLSGGNGIMANIEASLGLLKALQTCQAGCAEQSKSWELVGASGIKENKVKKILHTQRLLHQIFLSKSTSPPEMTLFGPASLIRW